MTFAVSSQNPTPSATVQRTDAAAFTLEFDAGLLTDVIIEATYASGVVESVYRNGAFGPQFDGTVSNDGDLYQFNVRRKGGWAETFTLQISRAHITTSLEFVLADLAIDSDFVISTPAPPYYDWMANEAGATHSFEPAGLPAAGALTTSTAIPGSAWVNTVGTHCIADHVDGGNETVVAAGFNGRNCLRFAAGGAIGPCAAGAGTAPFATWAGGAAPRSFSILAVVNVASCAALEPESTSYNNDAIIADSGFRYGLTVGYDSTGAIGGGAAGYYVCAWIYNGAFVAAYAYIGASLPANGFVCSMRYTNNGASSRIDVQARGNTGSKTGIAAIDSATVTTFIGKEGAGFGDSDFFVGDIGQLSFKDNATAFPTAIAAITAYWATAA